MYLLHQINLPVFPDSRVTARALHHLESIVGVKVIEELPEIWIEFAKALKFSAKDIDTLLSDQYPEETDKVKAIMQFATWKALLNVLREHNKDEIASQIEKDHEVHPDIYCESIQKQLSREEVLQQEYEATLKKKEQEIAQLKQYLATQSKKLGTVEQELKSKQKEIQVLKIQAKQLEGKKVATASVQGQNIGKNG